MVILWQCVKPMDNSLQNMTLDVWNWGRLAVPSYCGERIFVYLNTFILPGLSGRRCEPRNIWVCDGNGWYFLLPNFCCERNGSSVTTMDPCMHLSNCISNKCCGEFAVSPRRHPQTLLTNATTLQWLEKTQMIVGFLGSQKSSCRINGRWCGKSVTVPFPK